MSKPRHRRRVWYRLWLLVVPPLAAVVSLAVFLAPVQAFWSSTSAANGTGASKATTVNAGATPTVAVSGSTISVSWTATTLASGAAVTGYDLTRYDTSSTAIDPLNGCSGTVTTTSCTETDVPEGSWRYTVTPTVGSDWTGVESSLSSAVLVDTTPPTSSLSLTNKSGNVALNGTTVYYNGSSAGSFTITNAVADSGSGPASSATAALGGTTTGWSHNASTVTAPAGGPYVSNTFSWSAGTTSNPTETLTSADSAGNTTPTNLTFTEDSSAPTGTVSYTDGYSSGRSIAVSYTTTANGSPVSTAQLQRARASLKNGVCGAWGAFADVGPANPASPYVDGNFTAGACYQYQVVITDQAGNVGTATSTAVARIGYTGAVQATSGLVSYWRLGENAATATDSFTGTTGVALQDRTGETGATWTRHPTSTSEAVLTAGGRVRKDGTSATALYSSSGLPISADYRVSADVYTASVLTSDRIGVVGRLDPTAATYYLAAYDRATNAYTLTSVVGGTATSLGTYAATVAAGETHRITLDMVGTTIRVLVDNTQVISATSSTVTATGRGGVLMGSTTTTTDSDTYGMQLDNYVVGPVVATPAAADSKGSNTGSYVGGPTLGQPGALAGDADTALTLDGADDIMQVASPSGLPTGSTSRTVELWFKTTSTARQVLFDYGSPSTNAEFGLWINAGGKGFTAWGGGASSNDRTWSVTNAVTDGAWHQAVITFTGSALALYLDGSLVSSQSATRSTTVDANGFVVGAVLAANQTGATGGYFTGTLDEVAVYSTALSAATVTDHYALANPYQDVDGPTGGSVDGTNLTGADGRYRNTTASALTLALAKGTDPSGVAASGAQLQTYRAALSNNTCGAFSVLGSAVTDPASPYTPTVASNYCYRYRYVVPDTLGNTTTYASPTIKVDTSVPTITAQSSTTAGTNAYRNAATVYYRSAATSGSIVVTGKGADSQSAIAANTWPSLGTGWSQAYTSTQLLTNATVTYSWSAASPAAPGTKAYTSTNYAGLVSAGSNLTFTEDAAGPTGGALSYADGKTTASTTTITLTVGSDAASGVNGTKTIQVAKATAAGGVCGTFGAYATLGTTTSTTTYSASLASTDTCYKFALVVSDNVGNTTTYTSGSVVRRTAVYSSLVTTTSGILDFWRLGEASGATSAADSYTTSTTNTGTYAGSPSLGDPGAIVADTNTAATFDGTSQYVSMSRGLTGTNFSIELWFKSTQSNGGSGTQWYNGAPLADADASGSANDYGVSLASDGRVVAGVGTAGGTDVSIASQTGLNDGQWHYVVFTRTQSGGALVLYVDGVQVKTGTGGTGTLTASTTMTLARNAPGGLFYAGSLDEVATYSAVLSAATVTAHYNAGK